MTIGIALSRAEVAHVARVLSAGAVKRARIKAANTAGKRLRTGLPGILADRAQARLTSTRGKARAAHPSQAEPAYRLKLPARIPIRALKTKRFTRRKGGSVLEFRGLDRTLRFSRVSRSGKGKASKFRLAEAGSLPARFVGGLTFPRDTLTDSGRFPRVAAEIKAAQRDGADAFIDSFKKAVARPGR